MTDPIKFSCSHCQQSLEADLDMAGQEVECPACGKPVIIPQVPVVPPPIPKKKQPSADKKLHEKAMKAAEEKADGFAANMASMEEDSTDFSAAARAALEDLKRFDYSLLAPVVRAFSPRLLRRRAVKWLLGFGLFPLLVLYLSAMFGWGFENTAWFLGAYFCFFWIVFFNNLMSPEPHVKRKGMKWALFTMLVGIPVLLIWQQLPIIRHLYSGTVSEAFLVRVLAFVLGVGVCEELCKALPLIFFGRSKPTLLTPHNAIYLGIMSGLGFALAEVVQYSIQYWQGSAQVSAMLVTECMDQSRSWYGSVNAYTFADKLQQAMPYLVEYYGQTIIAQIVRFMSLPLLHAVWAGVVGYFIGLSLLKKKAQWVFIAVGIGLMAVIHGVYDVFSHNLIGFALALGSVLILMSYISEEETITAKVRLSTQENVEPDAGQVSSEAAPSASPDEPSA